MHKNILQTNLIIELILAILARKRTSNITVVNNEGSSRTVEYIQYFAAKMLKFRTVGQLCHRLHPEFETCEIPKECRY